MKIALDTSPITSAHSFRGIGTYTQNLVDGLEKLGIDLITFNPENKKVKADIFHFPYFDLFYKSLKPRSDAKNVVTIHDVIPLVFPNHFPRGIRANFNLLVQKKALKDVEAIICDSDTSKSDIVEKLNVKESKVHTIYLAASSSFKPITDTQKLNKIVSKYNLPSEFILYVGDVNWNKNVLGLIEAIKIAKVDLVLVGKALQDNNLPQVKEINEKIFDLNLQSRIKKLGFIPENDLVCVYNLASATVSPSFYEGFGLPVLESMSCATPVVCSNNSSLMEIAQGAFWCDPHKSESIANQILKISSLSPKEKANLGKKLLSHAKQFSWQQVAKDTIKVYESIL